MKNKKKLLPSLRRLSPCRNSTKSTSISELVDEQLYHFGIDPKSPYGQSLAKVANSLYQCQNDVDKLWSITHETIHKLDRRDRVAYFNSKKFLSFQLAKILDTLQNPFRESYQSLNYRSATLSSKGSYPLFDNVTALFSATPVIARTATYIYACAEWVEDAFKGKELLLEIYSRLLNPTSLSLANHIVDLEAGPYAHEYLAWNYNSGMAAIDSVLSHILGYRDVLITSKNIYGGTHQIINDWFAKPSNMNIAVEQFEGQSARDFMECLTKTKKKHLIQSKTSKRHCPNIYVFLESPSNPHGYVLDVPGICKIAHDNGLRVILDATIGTPFLVKSLQRKDPKERPDFVINSYTKDLSGTGTVIAGVVIGRNEDMFVPKGTKNWEQTMFWNVYYVKGAFLSADGAFEVLEGMRTLDIRMLTKCINTLILAKFLDSHPHIKVNANCLSGNKNEEFRKKSLFLGLPAPLFTIEIQHVSQKSFQRFFDSLSPTFAHMVSLGQTNTIVSCPGITTHSELSKQQQAKAGIKPTTIRFAVGNEAPKDLIAHLVSSAELTIDAEVPGFSSGFMSKEEINILIKESYLSVHKQYIEETLN